MFNCVYCSHIQKQSIQVCWLRQTFIRYSTLFVLMIHVFTYILILGHTVFNGKISQLIGEHFCRSEFCAILIYTIFWKTSQFKWISSLKADNFKIYPQTLMKFRRFGKKPEKNVCAIISQLINFLANNSHKFICQGFFFSKNNWNHVIDMLMS